MKVHQKGLLMIKFLIIALTLSSLSIPGETADKKVKGTLEEYTERSVKVDGWTYYLCEEEDMEQIEHTGIWVMNKKNEEVGYGKISGAREVTLFVKKDKRCVWKIKVHRFAN